MRRMVIPGARVVSTGVATAPASPPDLVVDGQRLRATPEVRCDATEPR